MCVFIFYLVTNWDLQLSLWTQTHIRTHKAILQYALKAGVLQSKAFCFCLLKNTQIHNGLLKPLLLIMHCFLRVTQLYFQVSKLNPFTFEGLTEVKESCAITELVFRQVPILNPPSSQSYSAVNYYDTIQKEITLCVL